MMALLAEVASACVCGGGGVRIIGPEDGASDVPVNTSLWIEVWGDPSLAALMALTARAGEESVPLDWERIDGGGHLVVGRFDRPLPAGTQVELFEPGEELPWWSFETGEEEDTVAPEIMSVEVTSHRRRDTSCGAMLRHNLDIEGADVATVQLEPVSSRHLSSWTSAADADISWNEVCGIGTDPTLMKDFHRAYRLVPVDLAGNVGEPFRFSTRSGCAQGPRPSSLAPLLLLLLVGCGRSLCEEIRRNRAECDIEVDAADCEADSEHCSEAELGIYLDVERCVARLDLPCEGVVSGELAEDHLDCLRPLSAISEGCSEAMASFSD